MKRKAHNCQHKLGRYGDLVVLYSHVLSMHGIRARFSSVNVTDFVYKTYEFLKIAFITQRTMEDGTIERNANLQRLFAPYQRYSGCMTKRKLIVYDSYIKVCKDARVLLTQFEWMETKMIFCFLARLSEAKAEIIKQNERHSSYVT